MIHSFEYCLEKVGEIGQVEQVKEFLVKVSGLPGATIGEGVSFETGEHGRVSALEEGLVEVLVLSRLPIKPKTKVARTGSPLLVSCGNCTLGHTLNTLGHSLTGRRCQSLDPESRPIEISPTGITARRRISRFFETGIPIVDLVVPIGHGQRELIIGDRKTGKTHFLMQTILAQAELGTICIYAALGKRKTEIKAMEEFLRKQRVLKRCLIIAADSYASPGEIFLAPYAAMTLAEYFRDHGKNVLLVLDDLTTHAKYYREIALLSGRFPSRESYPGDIFHLHSRLLERAGCFKFDGKETSITCLPVAESIDGDITGFIQTNLMSMTDGHIYFDSEVFFEGKRPAVNVFLSVTRVGRQTQSPLFRDLGRKVLAVLKKHQELQRFLRFGPEISTEIKNTIKLGDSLSEFFNQTGYWTVPSDLTAICLSLIWQNLWNGKDTDDLVKSYLENQKLRSLVGKLVAQSQTLQELNNLTEKQTVKLVKLLKIKRQ